MSKARITYRFDNETSSQKQLEPVEAQVTERERPHNAEQISDNVIPMYQEPLDFTVRDYSSWNSPFDVETERIEQLIRNSERNKAEDQQQPNKTRNQSSPAFYTTDQDEEPLYHVNFYEETPIRSTYRKRDKRTNWFSIASSITGAVLTGILLGMFVLSMFKGDTNPLPNTNAEPQTDNGLSAVLNSTADLAPLEVNDDSSTVTSPTSLLTAIIPEQTYYLIQNGVFSTLEGANQAVQLLKDKGLSGAIYPTNQFSVFAGISLEHDDALLLSHYLQNNKLEVFIKPFVIPAVQQIYWSGKSGDQIQGYLEKSRSLVQLISGLSTMGLQDSQAAQLTDSEKLTFGQQHQLWTESANQLAAGAPDDAKSLVEHMNKALNSAVQIVEQYDKNPTEAYLWQAQAAVAEHIIAQQQFIEYTTKL